MRKQGFLMWLVTFQIVCVVFAIKVYYEMKGHKVTGLILLPPLLFCIYLTKGHIKFPKSYKQLPLNKLMLLFVTFIFLILMVVVLIYFLNIPINFLLENKGITSIEGLVSTIGLFWIAVSLQVYYVWDNMWFNNES